MSWRVRLCASHWFSSLAVIAWRLGLGWFVGRRFALLTTSRPGGGVRHSVVPFVFAAGDAFTVVAGNPDWVDDVATKPAATAQAHPGPLTVRVRPVTETDSASFAMVMERYAPDLASSQGRRYVLAATGDPAPGIAPPDLVWVWPAAAIVAAAAGRRLLRRQRVPCRP